MLRARYGLGRSRRHSSEKKWRPAVRLVILLGIFGLFFLFTNQRIDFDFGWHLQTGNYIRAHGIPSHDIYGYVAPQFKWIDHEWGNDVVVSILYQHGGYVVAALWFALLWTAALVLVAPEASAISLLLAAVAVMPYAGVRAIAWTALFMAATLRVLRQPNKRWWWLLVPMFAVWANLHAGFIVGLAIIAFYVVAKKSWRLGAVLALSVLATFLNAYGARLYVEIARTLFDPQLHAQIEEWTPFSVRVQTIPFLLVWGVGCAWFWADSWRKWLQPSTFLLVSALSATRNVPLFIVGALEELDSHLRRLRHLLPPRLGWRQRTVLVALGAVILLPLVWGLYLLVWPLNQNRSVGYPVAQANYLRLNGCPGGRLFDTYDYGGYLIWQAPNVPVYIDGRMPTWRNDRGQLLMTHYYQVTRQPKRYYRREFARYNIKCAVLQNYGSDDALRTALLKAGWRPVVRSSNSVLLLSPK